MQIGFMRVWQLQLVELHLSFNVGSELSGMDCGCCGSGTEKACGLLFSRNSSCDPECFGLPFLIRRKQLRWTHFHLREQFAGNSAASQGHPRFPMRSHPDFEIGIRSRCQCELLFYACGQE
jgi:hypothetical protein